MIGTLLAVTAVAYTLVFLISILVVFVSVQDRKVRLVFILLSAALPPIIVWATIKTIIWGAGRPISYSDELARIEDEIEEGRVRIFGGRLVKPSFSETWKTTCMRSLAKSAEKIDHRFSLSNMHRPAQKSRELQHTV